MVLSRLSVVLLALLAAIPSSTCFVPAAVVPRKATTSRERAILWAKSHPEFKVVGEDYDEDESEAGEKGQGSGDFFAVDLTDFQQETANDAFDSPQATSAGSKGPRPEYGALSPGTVVQVQIGDLNLARKAWKKRRRTGSPLLVPCSVLNVDRQSMVRWNLIHLLEKFGVARKDGIEISATDLSKQYRRFLKSSLPKQSEALGYDSPDDMIVALFNKKTQEAYGVRLVEKEGSDLLLKAPISRRKAHARAAGTPVLEFRLPKDGDHGDMDTMTHTGFIKSRKSDEDADRSYHFLPLSAALRVSQKDDVESGRVEEGSIHPAVIFDFDLNGDGGSPLLTLSLNPRGVRETLKMKPDRKYTPIENPRHVFSELSVGSGPYRAKVVRFLKGKALVDLECGRKVSSEGYVKVLGTLRFQDSVDVSQDFCDNEEEMEFDDYADNDDEMENIIESSWDDFDDEDEGYDEDDEEEEDEGDIADALLSLRDSDSFEEGTFEDGEEEEEISQLFVTNEDGSLTYMDPESGEEIVLQPDDEDFEDMLMVQSQIAKSLEETKGETAQAETDNSGKQPAKISLSKPRFSRKMLKVGEDIDVYIRSMSKQSGQFTVTTNPLVKGRKAKDLKKESGALKKLQRLEKSLGGSLKKIWDLQGEECDGWVKATSNTGDWLYVQPSLEGLPVGVATLSQKGDLGEFSAGDNIRVRISGVDEERGQLSMEVLGKP